jgi:hypothetical protein
LQARTLSNSKNPRCIANTHRAILHHKPTHNFQKKHDELEEEYEKERAALEAKYEQLYAPLYAERAAVVSGDKPVAGAGGEAGGALY